MIELPMVFVAGLLGTAHCLGMCGPFALAIGGAAPTWAGALARQIAYTAGRVFTYGTLGASAGFCGQRLVQLTWTNLVSIPALLAILAGGLLVHQGLKATGLFRRGGIAGTNIPCLAGGFLGQFLRQRGYRSAFLAGVFTGLLPCGLLYGMVALALSTRSVALGGLTLVVFGLGTAPAMILAGASGRLMSLATRRWVYSTAAWCLVLTGLITAGRGVSFLVAGERPAAACPLCRP